MFGIMHQCSFHTVRLSHSMIYSKEQALKTLNKEKFTDYLFHLKTVLIKIEYLFAADKTRYDKKQISNTVVDDVVNYFLLSQDKI